MASSESVKDIFKQQALKQPKLELLDKVLWVYSNADLAYNWKSYAILWWNKNNWQVHILWVQ